MFRLKHFAAAVAVSVASVGAAGASTMLSGVFTVTAVNVTGLNSAQSQATKANYLAALDGTLGSGTTQGSDDFTYTGALDFRREGGPTTLQTIANWLESGTPGGVSGLDGIGGLQLSTGNIDNTTATSTFFLFTLTSMLGAGEFDITHDDGIAVYDDGALLGGNVGPTGETDTTVSGFDGGQFSILYVATNGNPSILEVSTTAQPAPVPVPAALPMLLAAMGGLGWMARRRRAAA